jgi:fatty acid desaturase
MARLQIAENESGSEDISSIRARIRTELPPQAFRVNTRKLVEALGYLAVACAAYFTIRTHEGLGVRAAAAIVIGICQLSIGFIAHDLSHGSVVRGKRAKAIVESLLWGLNSTPASVWIVIHNRSHHQNTNARYDSFRYFAETERTFGKTLFSLLFIPNRYLKWNPLVFQSYIVQIGMHTGAVLLGAGRKGGPLGPIPNIGVYPLRSRLRFFAELAFIVAVQVGLYFAVGGTLGAYLWAGPVAFLCASAGASAYLYTQHSLHPLVDEQDGDPFQSTSLRLPVIFDWLHSFHSHHTAHHLFPSMSSDYYPDVTRLLARDHAARLQQLGFLECWSRIFQSDLYKPNPERAPGVVTTW